MANVCNNIYGKLRKQLAEMKEITRFLGHPLSIQNHDNDWKQICNALLTSDSSNKDVKDGITKALKLLGVECTIDDIQILMNLKANRNKRIYGGSVTTEKFEQTFGSGGSNSRIFSLYKLQHADQRD